VRVQKANRRGERKKKKKSLKRERSGEQKIRVLPEPDDNRQIARLWEVERSGRRIPAINGKTNLGIAVGLHSGI